MKGGEKIMTNLQVPKGVYEYFLEHRKMLNKVHQDLQNLKPDLAPGPLDVVSNVMQEKKEQERRLEEMRRLTFSDVSND
jgi:hypothetical protein